MDPRVRAVIAIDFLDRAVQAAESETESTTTLSTTRLFRCSICMSEYFDRPHTLQCAHCFCGDCIKAWLTPPPDQKKQPAEKRQLECPLCRKPATSRSAEFVPALQDVVDSLKQARKQLFAMPSLDMTQSLHNNSLTQNSAERTKQVVSEVRRIRSTIEENGAEEEKKEEEPHAHLVAEPHPLTPPAVIDTDKTPLLPQQDHRRAIISPSSSANGSAVSSSRSSSNKQQEDLNLTQKLFPPSTSNSHVPSRMPSAVNNSAVSSLQCTQKLIETPRLEQRPMLQQFRPQQRQQQLRCVPRSKSPEPHDHDDDDDDDDDDNSQSTQIINSTRPSPQSQTKKSSDAMFLIAPGAERSQQQEQNQQQQQNFSIKSSADTSQPSERELFPRQQQQQQHQRLQTPLPGGPVGGVRVRNDGSMSTDESSSGNNRDAAQLSNVTLLASANKNNSTSNKSAEMSLSKPTHNLLSLQHDGFTPPARPLEHNDDDDAADRRGNVRQHHDRGLSRTQTASGSLGDGSGDLSQWRYFSDNKDKSKSSKSSSDNRQLQLQQQQQQQQHHHPQRRDRVGEDDAVTTPVVGAGGRSRQLLGVGRLKTGDVTGEFTHNGTQLVHVGESLGRCSGVTSNSTDKILAGSSSVKTAASSSSSSSLHTNLAVASAEMLAEDIFYSSSDRKHHHLLRGGVATVTNVDALDDDDMSLFGDDDDDDDDDLYDSDVSIVANRNVSNDDDVMVDETRTSLRQQQQQQRMQRVFGGGSSGGRSSGSLVSNDGSSISSGGPSQRQSTQQPSQKKKDKTRSNSNSSIVLTQRLEGTSKSRALNVDVGQRHHQQQQQQLPMRQTRPQHQQSNNNTNNNNNIFLVDADGGNTGDDDSNDSVQMQIHATQKMPSQKQQLRASRC